MGLFDFFANMDVEIMCASSRAWAAREEREAERRYREYKQSPSVSKADKKENEFDREVAKNKLNSFSQKYLNHSAVLEIKCIEIINEYSTDLIRVFQNSLIYKKHTLRLPQITRDKIADKVLEKIKKPLREQLTLENIECLKIMQQTSSTEQSMRIDNFAKKIQTEALKALGKEIPLFLNEQLDELKVDLEYVSEQQKKALHFFESEYKTTCNKNIKQKEIYEKNCAEAFWIMNEANEILNLLARNENYER